MDAAQFRHLALMRGVMAPDSVLDALFQDVKKNFSTDQKPGHDVQKFIGAYCSAVKARYKTYPELQGKDQGIAKRLVKDLGSERAIELVQTYLTMNDSFFQTKRHDLATFTTNLQAVVVKHQTGQGVSRLQAQSKENTDANTQAMQTYLAKKGKR